MSPDSVILTIKLFFSFLIVIGVALFLLRPMFRVWRDKPDMDLLMPDFSSAMEEGEELEIPTDEEAGVPERTKIIDQARSDPRTTAVLVQNWLKERK